MFSNHQSTFRKNLLLLLVLSPLFLFANLLGALCTPAAHAQSILDLRGSMSFKISRGRLSFKIGEVANSGTSGLASGRLELALWLSKQSYNGSQQLKGSKLATCKLDGIVGGETVANASCQARLKFISRGKYYVIVTLSELDNSTGAFIQRDFFTFSQRLKF